MMTERDTENLLQSLPPLGASPALEKQIQGELDLDMQWLRAGSRRRAPPWLSRVMWSSLGAAAAVAVMSMTPIQQPNPLHADAAPPATPSVIPIHTIREVVSTEDEGIQFNAVSRQPEQHVKVVSMERHAWIDPRDGAEITVEVPREDNVVLPASFQ